MSTSSLLQSPQVRLITGTKFARPDLLPAVTFNFAVPSINIVKTRSLENDTDYATLGIAVNAADSTQLNMYGPKTFPLGNLGNGEHNLGILVTGIDVPEGATMGISFTIANRGSSSAVNTFVSDLNEVCAGMLGAIAGGQLAGYKTTPNAQNPDSQSKPLSAWAAALIEVGILVVQNVLDALLADCDGMVVTDLLTIGRTELDQMAAQNWWSFNRHYSGTDSAVGCGSNSDYTVTYEVLASPPGVVVPSLLGASPAKVANILAPVGLVGKETSSSKGNVDSPEVSGQSPSAGWIAPTGSTVDYEVRVPQGGPHPLP